MWQKVKLRLGWRWDYLARINSLRGEDGINTFQQLELQLPVRNAGGRAAESCVATAEVKRLPPTLFVQSNNDAGFLKTEPVSGLASLVLTFQWIGDGETFPRKSDPAGHLAPGRIRWVPFFRASFDQDGAIVDFHCPDNELVTTPSRLAIRLNPRTRPVKGLITIYSDNSIPTYCNFSILMRGMSSLTLNLNRSLTVGWGILGFQISLPFWKAKVDLKVN